MLTPVFEVFAADQPMFHGYSGVPRGTQQVGVDTLELDVAARIARSPRMDSRLSPNLGASQLLLAAAYAPLSTSAATSRAKYPAAMSSCSASFYNSTSWPFTTVPKYDVMETA